MTNLIGKSLGRYHILEQLGEGGMAIVYKAYDTRLEADVAVKVIRTENLAPSILENALIRFEREAKSLAKLTHSNIVKVLDYGEYEGKPWLVMPYLPGGTLKQKLHGVPMDYQQAASLLIPIARALAFAHQQGMVHRDVKPSNILITQAGDPMLTDFGIAKIIGEETTLDLTGTSATIGTPEYMAPEQATSKNVDHRADIYALGIVLFEMVTGRKPYQADTPMAVLFKHVSEPLPRLKDFVSNLPDEVEHVILKALAKKPQDRYQNMGEFAAALEKLAHGRIPDTEKVDKKKDLSQESTVVDRMQTISQSAQTQYGSSSRSSSSGWQRFLALGMGGIGVVVIGICLVIAAVIFMSGKDPITSPEPTYSYEQPAATTSRVESTSRPPTSAPVASSVSEPLPTIPRPTDTPSCPRAKYPTRLESDRNAIVCTKTDRLIVRTSADMEAREIFSIYTGTTIKILEGPVCADDFWWWKIEIYPGTPYGFQLKGFNPLGTTDQSYVGWAREGWDNKDSYFICQ